jgi:hypothetical protein
MFGQWTPLYSELIQDFIEIIGSLTIGIIVFCLNLYYFTNLTSNFRFSQNSGIKIAFENW